LKINVRLSPLHATDDRSLEVRVRQEAWPHLSCPRCSLDLFDACSQAARNMRLRAPGFFICRLLGFEVTVHFGLMAQIIGDGSINLLEAERGKVVDYR
jgi:hypothetical protein